MASEIWKATGSFVLVTVGVLATATAAGLAATLLVAQAAAGDTSEGQHEILIQNGIIVEHDWEQRNVDLRIVGGQVAEIGKNLQANSGAIVLDATGKYVMPGGIDPHTHLAMPFMGAEATDDFFSGHAAALAGGTTFHIDFVIPTNNSLLQGYEEWNKKATKAAMDYGFHSIITSWSDKTASEMETLTKDHGINSFKFFLAYKGALMVTDEEFLQGLRKCKELRAIAQVHAENGEAVYEGQSHVFNELGVSRPYGHALSRPAEVEVEATARSIKLAELVDTPIYVVHVMSKGAMEEVARAKIRGTRVVGEAVVSGITQDESMLWHEDFDVAAKYVMSPPIRQLNVDGIALRQALATGILQVLATDHAVFNSTLKAAGRDDFRIIPNGVNGIEERMIMAWDTLVASGLMSPREYVRATSTAAAQIFNIFPQKGSIRVGSDADVIILDPNSQTHISAKHHHSRMDTNIYEGYTAQGKIETTISRGRLVWHNSKLNIQAGSGKFIKLPTGGDLFGSQEIRDKESWLSKKSPHAFLRSSNGHELNFPSHNSENVHEEL